MAQTAVDHEEIHTMLDYGALYFESATYNYPGSILQSDAYQAQVRQAMDMICRLDKLPYPRPAHSQTVGWILANIFGGAPLPAWLELFAYDSQYDAPS